MFPNGETVTRLRPLGLDQFGDPLPGTITELDIPGCAVWPRDGNAAGGNENTDFRNTVISGLMILAPPGSDIEPTDRFRVRGLVYEVDGEPGVWGPSPLTGTEAGVQVALKRVEG